MSVRWSGEWSNNVFYNDCVAPEITEGRGDGLPHYPNLSNEDSRRGLWFVCLPNFAVEVYADQFNALDEAWEEPATWIAIFGQQGWTEAQADWDHLARAGDLCPDASNFIDAFG